MRIAVIGFRFNCPTGRRNLLALQEIAKKYDVYVDILTVNSWKETGFNDKKLSELETDRLKIHRLASFFTGFGQYKYMMPGLVFKLLKLKPDIIYAAEEPSQAFVTFPSCILAKLIRKPFLFFTYENIDKKWPFPINLIEKFILRNSTRMIAATEDAKIILVKKGAEPGKVAVCAETGVQMNVFKPGKSSLNKKLGWKKEEIVLFVGRFLPEKGIDSILKAKEILNKRGKKYKYLFVGTGPLLSEMESLKSEDIKIIKWLPMERLPDVYNAASIFVYPSKITRKWSEQFGFSMIEALSCEVPVIASRVSGPKTIVKHNKDGILISAGKVDELAGAIERLMGKKELRREFGRFGREDVAKRLSDKAVASQLHKIMMSAL